MEQGRSFSTEPRAVVLDGRSIAAAIQERVGEEVRRLWSAGGFRPGLAVVLVGDDPASHRYVRSKARAAEALGFHSVQHTLPATTPEADLLALIAALNRDDDIHGILVQMPLPSQIGPDRVIEALLPEKDVDGFHPVNVGRLVSGATGKALIPCTPAGCLILARHALGDLAGRDAVVIGRSNIVGKPMAHLLLQENCTVTITHSRSRDLAEIVRRADIVVAAAGRPEMVRGDWLKPGAVVIDVGQNSLPASDRGPGRTKLVGDVAYYEAVGVAGFVTPVPGGVGPMTIAMLMVNTLTAAARLNGFDPPSF